MKYVLKMAAYYVDQDISSILLPKNAKNKMTRIKSNVMILIANLVFQKSKVHVIIAKMDMII